MNRNNKIARKMDDDIFNVQSPLLEEFKANGAISPENYRTLKRIYGDYRNIRELIS